MKTKNTTRQLIRSISCLLITGFLFTSLASYFVSRSALRSGIEKNELPLTSDNIYSEIQRDLIRPVFISSLMSTNTFLRDWVIDGEKDTKKIAHYLNDIKTKYNTVTSFFVSEKTKNYYYGGGKLKTVSPNDERDAWYFRVRSMKNPFEINVDPDMANRDTITIFINYRVYDYQGTYIGAIGVGLTVDFVKKLMESYKRKYGRNIYFVDRKGGVRFYRSSDIEDSLNIFDNRSGSEFKEKFGKAIKEGQGFFSYRNHGEMIHTNVRYIDEFDLYLVVEQPEGRKIRNIHSTLMINLVLCSVITGIILFLVSKTITAYQQRIKTLEGIIPICMHCKEIRDEKGEWNRLEHYITERSDARFSHGICPKCMIKHYPKITRE